MRDGAGSPVAVHERTTVLPRVAFTTVLAAITVGGTVCVWRGDREGRDSHTTPEMLISMKGVSYHHRNFPLVPYTEVNLAFSQYSIAPSIQVRSGKAWGIFSWVAMILV